MMNMIKKIFRNESGFILPTALVLLILGGLIVVPSLYLLQTILKSGQVVDWKTQGIYAADAGIEDALWKFKFTADGPFAGDNPYTLPVEINGMTVTVEMTDNQTYGTGTLYTVVSRAWLDGEKKAEIIAAPLVGGSLDLSWMFEHAITSGCDITIMPGTEVVGGVLYDEDCDLVNKGVIEGEVVQEEIDWPTCEMLSTYYLAYVDGLIPYPSSSISTSGWILANPRPIGSLYREGDLEINGGGCSRLDGIIYVDGNFNVQPNCTVDLNGQTIFATGSLNFQPNSIVYGPGCIIACGDVNFQPNMAPGNILLGVDDTLSLNSSVAADTFLLTRFRAVNSGSMTNFHVRCSDPGRVKLAVYADSSGTPGARLGAADTPDQAVVPGWNTLNFPATNITSGSYYWLSAIADNLTIGVGTLTSTKRYKTAIYEGFTFPNPAGSGFTIENNTSQYLFAGWSGSQEFIFVMSVSGTTTLMPGGTFYGSVAGDSEVYLSPHTSLTLVGLPEEGLVFPGDTGTSGGSGGEGDFTVQLLTYSVQ